MKGDLDQLLGTCSAMCVVVARAAWISAAFSTIMNERDEREGKEPDRKIIDLMLAQVPTGKVDGAYNRAAYMQRRRERTLSWASKLSSAQGIGGATF